MKRILNIILVLITAFLIYAVVKLLPDFYFNIGKNDYLKKDYVSAYRNLKIAIKLSPKNRDIRYYYVKTLINLQPTLQIQKELYEISQVNEPDSADLIADRQISTWKNRIFFNIGENYIEQVPFNNKILRWDSTKFPLKVYIKNNSQAAPQYYQDAIQKAFLQWQTSSQNFVNFEFINNENEADIEVSINSSADMKKCDQQDCQYTVAYTTPTINGDLLEKMDIFFYDSNNLGQPFGQREIYNTALHEIGHALGIMGHSYNKDDIMYMETGQDNYFDKFKSDFQLISQDDLNTLILLYKLVPDITNTPLSDFNKSSQFFAPIVMGSDEQINSRKLLEAQNYIKLAPNLPNGYIDLAAAYVDENRYNKALESLNQALELCSNDSERFMVYYNFAVVYMKVKDWENSLKYADMAKQINASSDVDGLIAMVNYNMGNKELAKETYIDAVKKSPDNIINSCNLATIYIKEFNFYQAGKTLNNLIKSNPDAKNDPRVKAYSIFTFLFK